MQFAHDIANNQRRGDRGHIAKDVEYPAAQANNLLRRDIRDNRPAQRAKAFAKNASAISVMTSGVLAV